MSEPDVARVSGESEAYVLIGEKTSEETEEQVVEEVVSITKVRFSSSTPSHRTRSHYLLKNARRCYSLPHSTIVIPSSLPPLRAH